MIHAICWGFAVALVTVCGPTGTRRTDVPTPDDQISIGYGTQNKRDATIAITSVSPTEADARVTRIEYLLQARVPGLGAPARQRHLHAAHPRSSQPHGPEPGRRATAGDRRHTGARRRTRQRAGRHGPARRGA